VPAVAGLRSPVILLPACAHSWPADHLRMVVQHELAHVRNRDLLRHVLADIACTLHWIDPACWLLRLRMHRAAEERADRAVLASGADAADYARILARLARGGARAPAPALIGRRSFLARRVDAILAGIPERDRTRPLASVLLLLVFALITAGWTLQRTIPSQIAELTVPPATLSATPERPPTPGDSLLDVVLMSWNVDERRSAATRLVAELGTGTIPRVAVLFGDTCHGGRWRAARAFRELRQPEALPLLVSTLLTDDTPAVRAMAINAIATSGLAEGIRLLRDALRDATPLQIAQVELAISTLGGTRAHAPLRALLQDVRAGRRPPTQSS
jgi:hypothetical protein